MAGAGHAQGRLGRNAVRKRWIPKGPYLGLTAAAASAGAVDATVRLPLEWQPNGCYLPELPWDFLITSNGPGRSLPGRAGCWRRSGGVAPGAVPGAFGADSGPYDTARSLTMDNPKVQSPALPAMVGRTAFQAELDELRVREKAHTREGDAIAAARRRLPMVEVDASLALTGPDGPVTLLDAFEGRRHLIACYFMWWDGHPAAEQCEGCTFYTAQVGELSYLHSRDITYAVLGQGPYDESIRYRDFMGWDMPWYSAQDSLGTLLTGRQTGLFHLVCYLRDGDRVFETYWTKRRGVEEIGRAHV